MRQDRRAAPRIAKAVGRHPSLGEHNRVVTRTSPLIWPRALASALVAVGLILAACTPPSAEPFVPSEAGVISSRTSTPTDTTFVLAGGRQLTFGEGVRWLNGMLGEGDLLLAGTSPTRWAATLSGNIEGPGGLRPCYRIVGPAWDRGDHLEIAYATGDGPVTLAVAKAPTWTSLGTQDSGQLIGTYTCLDASGRAVARERGGG